MSHRDSGRTPEAGMGQASNAVKKAGEPRVWNPAEPRDPTAHPVYRPRIDGAARPLYQLSDEQTHPAPPPIRARDRRELDMATFVKAVAAAFPEPLDPVGRRIPPTRPDGAARPLFFVSEQPPESAYPASEESAGRVQSRSDRPLVRPVLEAAAFLMLDLPYDPILAGAEFPIAAPRKVVIPASPEPRPHDRELIHTAIEPLEPIAKPRLPLRQTEAATPPSRLSDIL